MPKLGKYDELAHEFATKADIEAARLKAEAIVTTQYGPVQFDAVSRQRMMDVLRTLVPGAELGTPEHDVAWKMADNKVIHFTYEGLRDLIFEAESLAGPRALQAFQKAQTFKDTLSAGGDVTMRDISPENW